MNTHARLLLQAVISLLGISLALGSVTAVRAQSSSDSIKIGKVTFSGSIRVRYEGWDWFDTKLADGRYDYVGSIVRLGLGQQTTSFDWQVETAIPILLGVPENALAPPPQGQLGLGATYFASSHRQTTGIFLKQAFIRFKDLGGDKGSNLRLGRFECSDGAETTPKDGTLAALKRERIAQRLLGPFGFSHVGRSYDRVSYSRGGARSNFTFMAARATKGVFQLDGMDEIDVDVLYGAYTRAMHRDSRGEARFFIPSYHDGRNALKTDNRPIQLRVSDGKNMRQELEVLVYRAEPEILK